MRLKRSNLGARVCALVSFIVLSVIALTAAPAPALALPEGRVYEMVSPVYKGGYGANTIEAVAPDGESVAFGSLGAFAGDPANNAVTNIYIARRGESGWTTTPVTVPAVLAPHSSVIDYSSNLESSLSEDVAGPNGGSAEYDTNEAEFLLHASGLSDMPGNFEVAGEKLIALNGEPFSASYQGGSPDFSHIVFYLSSKETGGEASLLKEAVGTQSRLYDLSTGGGGSLLRLVGLNNSGQVIDPACGEELGDPGNGIESFGTVKGSEFNAVAAGGGEIFFSTTYCSVVPQQLFVRVAGSRTLEVSRPLEVSKPFGGCRKGGVLGEVPCEGAAARAPVEFQGANEAGTLVFFTTTGSLVGEDQDGANDLYMAEIGCPGGEAQCAPVAKEVRSLVQVSHDPHGGESAEVQNTVAIAPDGSYVYFVARGVLSEGLNAEGGAPVRGADNLYVYDSKTGGAPVFVADLCSGPALSGVVEDLRCPAGLEGSEQNDVGLWKESKRGAQIAGGGRILVFSSYGQLLSGDTDTAKDVYRYDAVTGVLERVSTGEGGSDANGNNSAYDATIAPNEEGGLVYRQQGLNSRAVSGDGSRIIFTSAEPLSSDAVNGLANLYEWHIEPGETEGHTFLVSSGSSTAPVKEAVISVTGNDVFFKTTQGLVPQDTDGQNDLYDARLRGGFPVQPGPVQPCSGDACQGSLANPAPLLVPGSVSQAPGENVSTPPVAQAKAKAKKPKAKRAKARKRKRSSRKPHRGRVKNAAERGRS